MKKIKVIVPVNNRHMINEQDLLPYQAETCQFYLAYPNTHLEQLNCQADVEIVWPLLLEMIDETKNEDVDVLIMYAFGDCAVKEAQTALSIPVLGLGRVAIPIASALARQKFSVIPTHMAHNGFIGDLVSSLNLMHNFVPGTVAINTDPKDVKSKTNVLELLLEAASIMIEEHDVDAFTFGCGAIMGYGEKLQQALRKKYNKGITVVDPVSVPFIVAKML